MIIILHIFWQLKEISGIKKASFRCHLNQCTRPALSIHSAEGWKTSPDVALPCHPPSRLSPANNHIQEDSLHLAPLAPQQHGPPTVASLTSSESSSLESAGSPLLGRNMVLAAAVASQSYASPPARPSLSRLHRPQGGDQESGLLRNGDLKPPTAGTPASSCLVIDTLSCTSLM